MIAYCSESYPTTMMTLTANTTHCLSTSAITEILQQHTLLLQTVNTPNVDTPLTAVVSDSRKASASSVFVALVGAKQDGHLYLPQALAAGCTTLVIQTGHYNPATIPTHVTVLTVSNTYHAFAVLNAALQGNPGHLLQMIGVTGTNGKTTVTHLIERILQHTGKTVGLVGTLGVRNASNTTDAPTSYVETGHTTPMADELQHYLATMHAQGTEAVVMEVSSHALDQHRVTGCDFQVTVITNLTQDHLDYHQTMERYCQAKAQLFARQWNVADGKPRSAVINADDAWATHFINAVPTGIATLTYGIHNATATVRATQVVYTVGGANFTVVTPQGAAPVRLKLSGEFNIYNALAALATGLALGIPLVTVIEALESVQGVRGRFEVVANNPSVIVDYAHTPDGLENVLNAARQLVPEGGRLFVVFGCGGDRDATKRPKMGAIAERLADKLVVTSDNPRSEDPEQIISDVLGGIQAMNPETVKVQADRRLAIAEALTWANNPLDIVVIAGKGHEDYQILATETIHFDDREEVLAFLGNRG
jgi:UDP-N-acetylmuramoyl-L-alanyl-D-glutamate--2,6-diaminopimelate ligase